MRKRREEIENIYILIKVVIVSYIALPSKTFVQAKRGLDIIPYFKTKMVDYLIIHDEICYGVNYIWRVNFVIKNTII